MRDFHRPGRSPVHALNGMAATSQPASTLVALEILRRGGNAIDAAIAACATLCVVEPQSTGIGGDCFCLYVPKGEGEVIAFNGSGRAPAAAETSWYEERGFARIPETSPHAVTVPGAIDAWARLLADHGTMDLADVLAPAIALAEEGYAVHARTAFDWDRNVAKLKADANATRILLKDGRAPREGEVMRLPELARTLRTIAAEGREGFYQGAVAEDMVGYLQSLGGLHTLDDFATHRGEYVSPIKTDYRGHELYECPPNGQGITALVMLNILAGFELSDLDPVGVERFHLEVEATRLAYAARDAHVADPALAEVPVAHLLSEDFAARQRARIRMDRALDMEESELVPAHPDTVYLCVVDKDRNAVSFINSTFFAFGSGLVSPTSGVNFQNRGCGFVVKRGHPNCIAPGKRPMHTIIPGMVMKDGRVEMPLGVMGGHFQPIGHVHALTNVVDYGMDEQSALDSPRVFHREGATQIEAGVTNEVAAGLAELGHEVVRSEVPFGGGQAIRIDWERGVLRGGSDPRKDGCALGY